MCRFILGPIDPTAVRDDWHLSSNSTPTVLSANRLAEVLPLLDSVAAATASGAWADVLLNYEAAPIFDNALRAQPLERLLILSG